MLRWLLFLLIILFFFGCKSSDIHKGKVIPAEKYSHYYVIKEQDTDKNVQEKVETFTDKIKNVFKKEPVRQSTPIKLDPKINSKKDPVTSSKKIIEVQDISQRPSITLEGERLVPMTTEQVEIVELKNTFINSVTFIQAIIILCLGGFIIYFLKKKKSTKIDHKVLNL